MSRQRLIEVFMFVWVLIAPMRPALASVMALPVVDLLLGLLCSYRAKRPITSSGIKRTVAKICLYEVATVLAYVVETNLTGSFIPVIKMVTGLIGVTELKSCLEHLDELGGQPLFASLLNRLAPPPDDK